MVPIASWHVLILQAFVGAFFDGDGIEIALKKFAIIIVSACKQLCSLFFGKGHQHTVVQIINQCSAAPLIMNNPFLIGKALFQMIAQKRQLIVVRSKRCVIYGFIYFLKTQKPFHAVQLPQYFMSVILQLSDYGVLFGMVNSNALCIT